MRATQLLSYALLSSTISAWSFQDIVDSKAVQGVEGLFRRQDSTSTMSSVAESKASSQSSTKASSTDDDDSNKPTSTMSAASSTDSSAASSTDSDSDSSTTTDKSAASTKGSASSGTSKTTSGSSAKSSGTAKTTDKATTSTSTFNSTDGNGGITMLTPNPASSSSYYKIGDYLTFAWNFTSLSITPTAVDILATCTANSATYTIAMNQSVSASTGAVTWDTGDYQNTAGVPLLTETYTLMIHDAAADVTATAAYGALSAYTQFAFAMYTKQAYTALSEGWQCVTCNGAMSQSEKQTMGFMLGMATLTVVSFTWFAGSFGVF